MKIRYKDTNKTWKIINLSISWVPNINNNLRLKKVVKNIIKKQ
jgi:hypothetical protein